MIKIGIIGGSGLDNPDIIKDAKDIEITTKYGNPSSKLKTGKIQNVDVVLLARHGRQHTIPPTYVNYRANIMALKEVGCTYIIATTAVGSLRKDIGRGDLVIIDQFIDFTRRRDVSFQETFDPHMPMHCPMSQPFSEQLRDVLNQTCDELKLKHHKNGTVVTIEGSRFSTKQKVKCFVHGVQI